MVHSDLTHWNRFHLMFYFGLNCSPNYNFYHTISACPLLIFPLFPSCCAHIHTHIWSDSHTETLQTRAAESISWLSQWSSYDYGSLKQEGVRATVAVAIRRCHSLSSKTHERGNLYASNSHPRPVINSAWLKKTKTQREFKWRAEGW